MNTIIKFFLILLCLAGYVYFSSVTFAENTLLLLIIMISVIFLCLIRFTFRKILSELKLLMPFITTMFVIYLLIGLLGIKIPGISADSNPLAFWFKYGLDKCLLFAGTVLFIQFVLSYVKIRDIMNLPFDIETKKHFILGRALFVLTINNISNLEFHLRLLPEYQRRKLTFRIWFNLKLQLTMGVIIMIIRESRLKGELIDNRLRHCFLNNDCLK